MGLKTTLALATEENLDHFFSEIETYSASFVQVVLDEGLNPLEESSGRMWLSRPGKFRWDYEPPLEQQIISDGEKVWMYDIDLEQVTIRSVSETLGRSPALLLSGGKDFKARYDIRDLGEHGAMQWIGLVAKAGDSGFEDIRIGFENGQFRLMELVDGLGQTTRLSFARASENPIITDDVFEIELPPGVDIIDETQ